MRHRGHIPALDGLRGLAILIVMIHHFTLLEAGSGAYAWWGNIAHLGSYGVDLFFVLSGFLITGILLDAKGSPHYFKHFYIRRFLRIFPLYYAFLLVCLFIVPHVLAGIPAVEDKLEGYFRGREHWQWYFLYGSNFLVAKQKFFGQGGIDITWSLAIEEHFYLVWPWIISKLQKQQVPGFCLFIVLSALVTRCVMWTAGYAPIQIYVVTFSRMDTIALGGLIAYAVRSQGRWFKITSRLADVRLWIASCLGMVLFFLTGCLDKHTAFLNTAGYTLIALFFAHFLIHALASTAQKPDAGILTSRALTFLGKYSYALYLIHIPTGAMLRYLLLRSDSLTSLPGPLWMEQILYYILAILATIPLALLSWNLLEKQALKLKRYYPMEHAQAG